MDDFETFKASREKIDPLSRKFSERQWEKAYAAYRSSRKRVNEVRQRKSKGGEGSKRGRSSGRGSSSRKRTEPKPVPLVRKVRVHRPVGGDRNEIRQNSAYRDLRIIVDVLAWIAITLVVLSGTAKLFYYTNTAVALVALLNACLMVIVVVVFRFIIHVLIDIPDIALFSRDFEPEDTGEDQSKGES